MPALTAAARAYDQAYEQMKISQAEKARLELEKLQLDVAERRRQQEMASPSGRVTAAAEAAAALEQDKQMAEGIQIGPELAKRSIEAGGPSLLQATKMQGEMDVESKVRQAKRDALTSFLMGEQSLVPTAKIDIGGMTSTVPFGAGGERMANAYDQIYTNMVPQLAKTYMAEGFDRDTATRMASDDIRKQLVKAGTNGKVVLAGADGVSTISYSNEEAQRMWKDPKTPKHLRDQLNGFFGAQEGPTASDWVKNQTRR